MSSVNSPRRQPYDALMLVGRSEQLAILRTLRNRAREGAGQVLVVEGEAGIGKSAILAAAAQASRDDGFAVLVGRSDELGVTRPFAPLLDALSQGPAGDECRRDVLERMAQERYSPRVVLDADPGLQSLLIEDLVTRIEELCVERPVNLCVDDLHWADASTLAALASLVRRTGDLPLLVVLTRRTAHRRPDVDALVEALGTVEALSSGAQATRIELGPLERSGVDALAASVVDAQPAAGLRGLVDGCAGNPLLIVEVLTALRDAGMLEERDGRVHTTTDVADLTLPTTLIATVRRRMARLDERHQAAATVGALLGTRFTVGDLAAVTGRPMAELVPLVQSLLEVHLFVDDGSALSFRHDLVREAVASALRRACRAELHREIAAALQRAGAPRIRVAEHLALGAQPGSAEAIAVLVDAAAEVTQQDPAAAESLLRRALELSLPTDAQRDLLSARLVDTLAWGGRLNEAEATAEQILSRPVSPDAEIGLRSALSRSLLLLAQTPRRHSARGATDRAPPRAGSLDRVASRGGGRVPRLRPRPGRRHARRTRGDGQRRTRR